MAKISIDVEELKKNLVDQALTAKTQITDFAKRAQKDLETNPTYKKVEQAAQQAFEKVKAQESVQDFLKNPKVNEIKDKLVAQASSIYEEVLARVNKPAAKTKEAAKDAAKEVVKEVKKAKKAVSPEA